MLQSTRRDSVASLQFNYLALATARQMAVNLMNPFLHISGEGGQCRRQVQSGCSATKDNVQEERGTMTITYLEQQPPCLPSCLCLIRRGTGAAASGVGLLRPQISSRMQLATRLQNGCGLLLGRW